MDVCSYCKVCQIFLSLECAEIRDQVRTTVEVDFYAHHFWCFHLGILIIFLMTLKSLLSQAFELLCDLLLLYSPSSARNTPALQTLVYLPSDSLRCDMAGFLIDYIFSDTDSSDLDGQYLFRNLVCFPEAVAHSYDNVLMFYHSVSCLAKGEEEMKIILLQKKRNQLAGYCKLVIYGVLDLVAATDVFKHYSKVEMIKCHKWLQEHLDQSHLFLQSRKYVHEN